MPLAREWSTTGADFLPSGFLPSGWPYSAACRATALAVVPDAQGFCRLACHIRPAGWALGREPVTITAATSFERAVHPCLSAAPPNAATSDGLRSSLGALRQADV